MEKINDVVFLPVDKIKRNPNQPRKVFNADKIKELALSIENVGVIQPISVRQVSDVFELIAGERRLLATKEAGLSKIPAVVIEVSENNSAVLALIENIQREDLDFIEEAMAYKSLSCKFNVSQKDIASQVGKSQSTISNKLRLLKLSQSVLDLIKLYGLSERHARALLKLNQEELQEQIVEKIHDRQLNVRQTERLIASILEEENNKKRKRNTNYRLNHLIYVNTIKNAYDEIVETGIEAEYEKIERDDFYELKIIIPK